MNNRGQYQSAMPLTPMVKKLIIANAVIWIGGVLILEKLILHSNVVSQIFGLVPKLAINSFYLWQFFTYMFLHSSGNYFHILFNMLSLWWFGSELEQRWGGKFFLTYFLVCGVGAGVIYAIGTLIYGLITGNPLPMETAMVGASGATYGLLLAYGMLFGEREIFFMMLFPMKAKFFVMIIGLIELVTLLDSGMSSEVATLAHLGGIFVGFVFLAIVARYRAGAKPGVSSKRGRRLKLVVDNERPPEPKDPSNPKYWN